jgi:hypothetical protein
MGQIDTSNSVSVFTRPSSDSDVSMKRADAATISIATTAEVTSGMNSRSISSGYLENCSNRLSGVNDRHLNGGRSPESPTHQQSKLHGLGAIGSPMPDRGRSRKVTHIPVSAQHSMYRDMEVPVRYNGGQARCMPQVSPTHVPRMPHGPPPPPPHAPGSLSYFQFPDMPTHTSPDFQDPVSDVAVKRLSIPPSTVFRPFLQHGSLPLSPAKTGLEPEQNLDFSTQPATERSSGRKRAETGGVLRAVMTNALKRRMTDGKMSMHQ